MLRPGRVGSARSDGGISVLTGVCPAWSAAAGFADAYLPRSTRFEAAKPVYLDQLTAGLLMSFNLVAMPIPPDLEFDPGPPPQQWLEIPYLETRTRGLCLWEMTVGLIHNEKILSENPRRFLAMVHEHKVSTHIPGSP